MNDIARRALAPAEGGRVRKPDGSVLAAAGENVVFDSYWQRRLDQGDVVAVEPAAAPPASAENIVVADPATTPSIDAEQPVVAPLAEADAGAVDSDAADPSTSRKGSK